MTKAEERALEAVPPRWRKTKDGMGKVDSALPVRKFYIRAYEAAQKDLEPIRTHLHSIVEAAKRIQSLDGKDADVCDAVQDILVAAKSIEGAITE